ncbi:MAG: hypothetical protein MI867_22690 [Pseudomonadales bacterium]|nr:hypothetical protein [Pseudomonadales bacterium]
MDRLTGHDEHESNIADEDKFHLARRYYNLLQSRIDNFKNTLPSDKCVGVRVSGFGDNSLFKLEEIHYADPSLIALSCKSIDGLPVEIIQEVSHINLALVVLDAASHEAR